MSNRSSANEGPHINTEASNAADLQFSKDAGDIGAIILENLTSKAERESRSVEPLNFIGGASGLLAAIWNLAKLAGPKHRAFYVDLLRRPAETIEGQDI